MENKLMFNKNIYNISCLGNNNIYSYKFEKLDYIKSQCRLATIFLGKYYNHCYFLSFQTSLVIMLFRKTLTPRLSQTFIYISLFIGITLINKQE